MTPASNPPAAAPLPPPLLTETVLAELRALLAGTAPGGTVSLDLGRSRQAVEVDAAGWSGAGQRYPWPARLRPRTVYAWEGGEWMPLARYGQALVKLVPTDWGPPTFEIDGIKMLATAQLDPLDDARRKVALVQPRGRRVLETCGGLGYFSVAALEAGAAQVLSHEKSPEVLWLRRYNPWSPRPDDPRLQLREADITQAILELPTASVDALLHDPPRFSIAGELYALAFYRELARVLRPGGWLFHYTGSPQQRSRGRDLPGEVIERLREAGLRGERALDGVRAQRL
ncbi:MAG TPA: SAM-dependent methyltransferase [Nevskiaceae bacterium]|nr:SAM-dependent methyltransferase [Nevskiaceae bacterium]